MDPAAMYQSPANPGLGVVLPGIGIPLKDAIALREARKQREYERAQRNKLANVKRASERYDQLGELDPTLRYSEMVKEKSRVAYDRLTKHIMAGTNPDGDPALTQLMAEISDDTKMSHKLDAYLKENVSNLDDLPVDKSLLVETMIEKFYDDNPDNPFGVVAPGNVDYKSWEDMTMNPHKYMPELFDLYEEGRKIAEDREKITQHIVDLKTSIGKGVAIEELKSSLYKGEDENGNPIFDETNPDVRNAFENHLVGGKIKFGDILKEQRKSR
jgi:hypothetical protein